MAGVRAIAGSLLEASWEHAARRAARVYVAGPELDDAVRLCRALARSGHGGVMCRWNDSVEGPRRVADTYLASARAIERERLDCQLAIKATALGLSRELVSEVVLHAGAAGVTVRLDAQAHRFAEPTLALAGELAGRVPELGVALPGRFRRSLGDVERVVEHGLTARVVKGQYPDPADPTPDLRRGFLAVVRRLADRGARHVAVATHDAPLAREALGYLKANGAPCCLELLLGLPFEAALREAVAASVPVRVYVPYGAPSVPYHYGDAREDPRIVSWLIQDLLLKQPSRLPRPSRTV